MRKATRTAATWLGIVAGIGVVEHGYFEILQGNTRPDGLVISSIGPPCVPEEIWNNCEPAMTILPNFLITGILSVLLGLLILIWCAGFMGRRSGGLVLIALSVISLLFGGGFFPPLIGIVGGTIGTKVHKPIKETEPGRIMRIADRIWPWPLVIFVVWVLGQIPVGYFFNDFMTSIMIFGVSLILVMLPVSGISAYARDLLDANRGEAND